MCQYLQAVQAPPTNQPDLDLPRQVWASAVRWALAELASSDPGRSLEVRVPPYGAVQMLPGTRHSRGTPPAVVQIGPAAFLDLVTGRLTWQKGLELGLVEASGQGADLSAHLPLNKLLD